ncbi:hypothetical protein OCB07_15870 [Bacillus cereus]|nr:hypothetical protein [Bacillus cereus]
MSEQMNIFELEPYVNNVNTVNHDTAGLEQIGFSHVLPLGVDKQGRAGYRAVYEGKSCTVNIDDGHVMIKDDGNRFWDYIGNYIRD